MDEPAISDRRRLRGAQSRRRILRHAVDLASLDGLDGLSLGRLATDAGLSKSGVQTLFRTKETLQLAVIQSAHDAFDDAVIRPALAAPAGSARLRAMIDRWIVYAEAPLFAGGCFWAANLPHFDSRPGRIRDTLIGHQRDWRGLIAAELRHAAEAGEIPDLDPDLAAFQMDAVLIAANTALRIGDDEAVGNVRRAVDGFLTASH